MHKAQALAPGLLEPEEPEQLLIPLLIVSRSNRVYEA